MRRASRCLAKHLLAAAQHRQKEQADRRRSSAPEYAVNQEVMLNTKNLKLKVAAAGAVRKLLPLWVGPFKVTQRISEAAYRLEIPATMSRVHIVFHVSLLKPYVRSARTQPAPPPVLLEDEEWFQVETILQHRKGMGQTKYLRRFKGYSAAHDQWIPEDGVSEVAVTAYWAGLKAAAAAQRRK